MYSVKLLVVKYGKKDNNRLFYFTWSIIRPLILLDLNATILQEHTVSETKLSIILSYILNKDGSCRVRRKSGRVGTPCAQASLLTIEGVHVLGPKPEAK